MNLLGLLSILGIGAATAAFAYFFILRKGGGPDSDPSSTSAKATKRKAKRKKGAKKASEASDTNPQSEDSPKVSSVRNDTTSSNASVTPPLETKPTEPTVAPAKELPTKGSGKGTGPKSSKEAKASEAKKKTPDAPPKEAPKPSIPTHTESTSKIIPKPEGLEAGSTPDSSKSNAALSQHEAGSYYAGLEDDDAQSSRVLRLKSSDRDLSASEEAEDGWMVVKDVPRKPQTLRIVSSAPAASKPQPSSTSASEAPLTKTQLKNQRKAEKAKEAKRAMDELQEQRMKDYRKQQQQAHVQKLAKEEREKAIARELAKNAGANTQKAPKDSGSSTGWSGGIWD
ncbi:hypothetical protein HDU96_000850 [Phlyctochytrium bullatum]|nr:hypothetical protein HDU96_000850 [Phlyctochytrium bullatum]